MHNRLTDKQIQDVRDGLEARLGNKEIAQLAGVPKDAVYRISYWVSRLKPAAPLPPKLEATPEQIAAAIVTIVIKAQTASANHTALKKAYDKLGVEHIELQRRYEAGKAAWSRKISLGIESEMLINSREAQN